MSCQSLSSSSPLLPFPRVLFFLPRSENVDQHPLEKAHIKSRALVNDFRHCSELAIKLLVRIRPRKTRVAEAFCSLCDVPKDMKLIHKFAAVCPPAVKAQQNRRLKGRQACSRQMARLLITYIIKPEERIHARGEMMRPRAEHRPKLAKQLRKQWHEVARFSCLGFQTRALPSSKHRQCELANS